MFLKRLDIIGFKSFADKTYVEFSPGITGVVGPNGSGKSNIADSIRWVLGEQSARSLRGSKMEDVIFAGSETRRSINFCEVSLTLDNADKHLPVVFDEVTVTRRVYRSGESEYMINKQPCRLKDIHELFMDSGLGRESYSIIGQGKIEEMLSTRPEDRRGPFEDAAGIVKFKFRRKEAERKLDETAANLVRVDDILAELERQAGPLEVEAKRAEEYKRLTDELTALDISLLVNDIEGLKSKWTQSSSEVSRLTSERGLVAEETEKTDEKLRAARTAFENKSAQVEAMQQQFVEAVERRQRTDGQHALLQERYANTGRSIEDKKEQQEQVAAELSEVSTLLGQLMDRLSVVDSKLSLQQAELEIAAHAVDPLTKSAIEAELEQLNVEMIEMHHQAATFRNEIKSAEEALLSDDLKQERFAAELEKWQGEIESYEQRVQATLEHIEETKKKMEATQAELGAATEAYREAAKREAECVGEMHKVQSELASLKSRLELLKDLEDGYDGYALGVKTVMLASTKGRLAGIHGSVAALIHVEKRYEQAIETALGGSLQNVVVDTEADARAAISMLKQRQAGRATFMPLEVIKSRLLSDQERAKVQGAPGFVGIASELVRGQFRNIIEHLLGNVVIAETLVHANDFARRLGYKVRIVTLEGDVVSPGGVMSGGSHARKGPGLLGRSRERSDLEQLISSRTEQLQNLQQLQERLRNEMTEWQTLSKRHADTLRELEGYLTQLSTNLHEERIKQQSARERLEALEWEWQQLQSGQNALHARAAEARQGLQTVEAELLRIEGVVKEKRQALEAWEQSVATMQERLTTLRVEVATLGQEREAMSQRKVELSGRESRLEQRLGQLEAESTKLAETKTDTEEQLKQSEREIALVTALVADLEKALSDVKQERFQIELEVQAAEKESRAKHLALTEFDERLHRAEVVAERADVELNHALTKIGEVYEMTYEWAKEHYPAIENADEARRGADRLRRQIHAMGGVQIGAIEEWNRLSERIGFLHTQRTDLLEAEAQLNAVIAEIDEEMSRRFMTTFEQIRNEFQVAFRQLFNGGHADLELTTPDDPLNTGIEVIARPPGKKLQNLNLMSGGERALTAMALLFAILRVRPVPFCVLDEVEAALDEANVSRFAQQLRTFSDETQFIVITHRRGTMEEADVLYGVTMQESGISSLIGVRLSDELDIETA